MRFYNAAFFALLLISGLCWGNPLAAQVPIPERKPDFQAPSTGGIINRIGNLFGSSTSSSADASTEQPVKSETPQRTPTNSSPVRAVLSSADAELYKEIFALQRQGRMDEAGEVLKKVSNSLLLGHVLYQRYMHPDAYTSSAEELQNWLENYSDHAGAEKIHFLAQRKGLSVHDLKTPQTYESLPRVREPTMRAARLYVSKDARTPEQKSAVVKIKNEVRRLVRSEGGAKVAHDYVAKDSVSSQLDSVEIDILKGDIAAAYLYQGNLKEAYALAVKTLKTSPQHAPKAAWVAGLISWYRDDYDRAAQFFEVAADSPYASGWLVTAASYWTARSNMRTGNVREISPWLEKGMAYPRTFYGLISTRALGVDFDFNWELPTFTKEYHEVLTATPYGARAVALARAGMIEMAQYELLRHKPKNGVEQQAMLAFAGYANLPALGMRLASADQGKEGVYYDAALYPLIPWQPTGGYKIGRGLMHAVMKQESRFDPNAQSPSGAMGLMQLIPSTARSIGGDKADMLDDPAVNLEIGQNYLHTLLKLPAVDGDLLYLLIAYNAGPGNLVKWKKLWPDVKDPLLFIELIPAAETRGYIERVLANYWIYRMREALDLESLDMIAAGQPAYYKSE